MPTGFSSYLDWIVTDLNGNEITIPKVTWTLEAKDKTRVIPGIKQVIFNKEKGYTTILWTDGSSTVVHCGESDHFERYFGFCAAIMKKLFGSTTAAKALMDKYDLELEKERKEQDRQKRVQAQLELERKNRERKEQERVNTAKPNVKMKNFNNNDIFKELLSMICGGDRDGD